MERRVMFIGGQENGVERTVVVSRCPTVCIPRVHSVTQRLRGSCPMTAEVEMDTYVIRQVGRDTYIAILEELL